MKFTIPKEIKENNKGILFILKSEAEKPEYKLTQIILSFLLVLFMVYGLVVYVKEGKSFGIVVSLVSLIFFLGVIKKPFLKDRKDSSSK